MSDSGLTDFAEAILIFKKYGDSHNPFHCEHDELWVCVCSPDAVSEEDRERLDELGFFVDEGDESIKSFRFGSC